MWRSSRVLAVCQLLAIRSVGLASGLRCLAALSAASGTSPLVATARLRPKWSSSISRPAVLAASFIVAIPCFACSGVRKLPSQPSAFLPILSRAAGAWPPSQMSSGFFGLGPIVTFATLWNLPWNVTSSSVSSRRSSVSVSSNTAALWPGGTSNNWRSSCLAGLRPNAGRTLAGARAASDSNCLATSTGCRPGSTATPVPSFSFLVRPKALAMPTIGSTDCPNTTSDSHSESMPVASSSSTVSPNVPGSLFGPNPTPMRTFTPPSDHAGTVCRVDQPLPSGFRLSMDVGAQQVGDSAWFGGSPEFLLRLTPSSRSALAELLAGAVVSRQSGLLARRLTDVGLAHPCPPVGDFSVTVVVPVRDRVESLDRCLGALVGRRVVVVDDGSVDPAAVAAVVGRHGATVVRRAVNGGAGPARNTGLSHVSTELVAFVDSDCVAAGDWIEQLAGHFLDPLVAAVAPRVAGGLLDLGDQPARVLPGARVSYVPTAALLVRRSALVDGPAFDEGIGRGEDVDLVWRLHERGWRIRYDPAVVVQHDEPSTRLGLLARHFRYGRSAAPLAVRHPSAVRPLVLCPWPTLAVLAMLARRPGLGVAAYLASVLAMVRALHQSGVSADGVPRAMLSAGYQTWRDIGRYLITYAAPLVLVLVFVPGGWRRVGPLVLPALLRRPVLFGALDDIAYGAGVWVGCVSVRTTRPLWPVVLLRPLRSGSA